MLRMRRWRVADDPAVPWPDDVLAERSGLRTPGLPPSGPRLRSAPWAWALAAPALSLFALGFVLPLLTVAVLSLLSGNPVSNPRVVWTTRNYARLVADDYYVSVLLTTLLLAVATTIAALLIGYPLAYRLARMKPGPGRSLLLMAVLAPMLIGIVIRTYAWMTLLSEQGLINAGLRRLGLISAPLPLMYNRFGIVVALVHIYTPYMVLTLAGVLARIDRRLEEAAQGLGASPPRSFFEVTLPLSLPGILAGSLLVFALAVSAYVTPTLIGGFQVTTLPMLIYQQINGSLNLGFAGALGVLLLAVSLAVVAFYGWAARRVVRA